MRVRSTEQSGVSGETTKGKRREIRSACTGVFRSLYAPPTDMSIKAVRKHRDMRIEEADCESAEHGAIRGVRRNHQGQKTRNAEQSVGIMNN